MNNFLDEFYEKRLISSIEEYKDFDDFVFSRGAYSFEERDGTGGYSVNHYHTIDAIYKYYGKSQKYDLPKMVQDAYDTAFATWAPTYWTVDKMMVVIQYQLSCQRNGLATFRIDFEPIIDKLKKYINENAVSICADSPYGKIDFNIVQGIYNNCLGDYGFHI